LALEKVKWNVNKNGRVAEILTEVAMSSEESREESDGEGGRKVVSYTVKKLNWESERMKKADNHIAVRRRHMHSVHVHQ
jgi:hypothetical protein